MFGQGEKGGFQLELETAVPTAFHMVRVGGLLAAVYVSLSIYLRPRYLQTIHPPRRFAWYSSKSFDLEQDVVTGVLLV